MVVSGPSSTAKVETHIHIRRRVENVVPACDIRSDEASPDLVWQAVAVYVHENLVGTVVRAAESGTHLYAALHNVVFSLQRSTEIDSGRHALSRMRRLDMPVFVGEEIVACVDTYCSIFGYVVGKPVAIDVAPRPGGLVETETECTAGTAVAEVDEFSVRRIR